MQPAATGAVVRATPTDGSSETIRPSFMRIDALGMACDIVLVGDHDQRPATGGELVEQREHLLGAVAVERAGGLVGEQQDWLGHDRAGDSDALLLAAGQLRGQVVQRDRPSPTRASAARRAGGRSAAGTPA